MISGTASLTVSTRTKVLLTTETTIELEGLIGGETAQYTIVASNGLELDSLASDSVSLLLFGDDITPPTKPTMTLSSVGWTNQDVTLTVTPGVDSYSGVWKSEYRIGIDGSWIDYDGPVVIDTEGETLLYARTLDHARNIGEEEDVTVKIDRIAPAPPSSLIKTHISETTVDITWSESTDNMEIATYRIYQEGLLQGDTDNRAAHITGLTPASVYRLTVRAVDVAGNESASSKEILVSTFRQPRYHYDPAGTGRLVRIQYEDGSIIHFEYDVSGNLLRTYMQP